MGWQGGKQKGRLGQLKVKRAEFCQGHPTSSAAKRRKELEPESIVKEVKTLSLDFTTVEEEKGSLHREQARMRARGHSQALAYLLILLKLRKRPKMGHHEMKEEREMTIPNVPSQVACHFSLLIYFLENMHFFCFAHMLMNFFPYRLIFFFAHLPSSWIARVTNLPLIHPSSSEISIW